MSSLSSFTYNRAKVSGFLGHKSKLEFRISHRGVSAVIVTARAGILKCVTCSLGRIAFSVPGVYDRALGRRDKLGTKSGVFIVRCLKMSRGYGSEKLNRDLIIGTLRFYVGGTTAARPGLGLVILRTALDTYRFCRGVKFREIKRLRGNLVRCTCAIGRWIFDVLVDYNLVMLGSIWGW